MPRDGQQAYLCDRDDYVEGDDRHWRWGKLICLVTGIVVLAAGFAALW